MICFLVALAALAFGQPANNNSFQGRVSGVVVDHLSHHPLNHVLVQMTPVTQGLEELSMLTSEDGAFVFENVLAGKYQLTAQKRGQSPQAFRGDGFYGTAIVVGPDKVSKNLVFSMRVPASIRGTLLDDEGNPIQNAAVTLLRQATVEGESTTTTLNNSTSDLAGQFHFSHLDPGNYYVAAQGVPGGGQPAKTVYPITFYGDTRDAQAARVIHLGQGDSIQLQINLHALPAIEVHLPDSGTITASLSIAGPQGARVPVNTVFETYLQAAGPMRGPDGVTSYPGPSSSLKTLSGLIAGHYLVSLNRSGPGVRTSSTVETDLEDGMTLPPDMGSRSTVTGRVAFDAAPDPGKRPRLLLYSVGEQASHTEVNADGTFGFGNISAGAYEIGMGDQAFVIASVTAKGARIQQDKLQISAGASIQLAVNAVTRNSLSSLDGFVLDGLATTESGGVAGAMVLLVPQNLTRSGIFRRDQSDSDGSFSMRDILPGRYTLVAIEDGHDLAYKSPDVIHPYLAKGVAVTIPLQNHQPVTTLVQKRLK